jgi:NADH:ubiquinone reductase (H+-translocating)
MMAESNQKPSVVINSTDYFLYLPLMPQVAGGLVEPAHIRVSLPDRDPGG